LSQEALRPAYRVETPRLVVRCWSPADAPLLAQAIEESVEHLRPWMPWIQREPLSLDARVARLRKMRGDFDLGVDHSYGIFDRGEEKVLGGAGLHPKVGEGGLEIGYWIHVAHTGKGLATEAAAALTRVAFDVHEVDRVEIHCGPDNGRSAAVPRKLGYTLEATLRRRLSLGEGGRRDTMIWSIFAGTEAAQALRLTQAKAKAFDVMGRRLF
jgi:RimJ/RimL family protein N-acetyltransferase